MTEKELKILDEWIQQYRHGNDQERAFAGFMDTIVKNFRNLQRDHNIYKAMATESDGALGRMREALEAAQVAGQYSINWALTLRNQVLALGGEPEPMRDGNGQPMDVRLPDPNLPESLGGEVN